MNMINSFFFGSQADSTASKESSTEAAQRRQLSGEQESFIKHLKTCDGVFKILSEHDIEDILCTMVEDIEFSQMVKRKDKSGQDKRCLMLNSKLSFRVQDVVENDAKRGDDITLTIPCICIENAEYDPD